MSNHYFNLTNLKPDYETQLFYFFNRFYSKRTTENTTYTRLLFTSNVSYNKKHSYQKSVFNFELGEMHTDHTQLANYMKEVAKVSHGIAIETTGYVRKSPLQLQRFQVKLGISRKLTSNTSLI
jgi:hypothetical protein